MLFAAPPFILSVRSLAKNRDKFIGFYFAMYALENTVKKRRTEFFILAKYTIGTANTFQENAERAAMNLT